MASELKGSVYVLTNPAMPGLVKVGCTGRTPEIRAAELTASTGVPAPFVVAWAAEVTDHARVESLVHAGLQRYRSNNAREFFRCDVATARASIEKMAGAWLRPWWWKLLHPLPRPKRLSNGWRRSRRRGSADGLIVLAVLVVIAAPVVILKPDMPSWLPASVIRAAVLLERLR